MPVKVYKRSGRHNGRRFKYVTAESAHAPPKSRHTNKKDADASARIRNAALKNKRRRRR